MNRRQLALGGVTLPLIRWPFASEKPAAPPTTGLQATVELGYHEDEVFVPVCTAPAVFTRNAQDGLWEANDLAMACVDGEVTHEQITLISLPSLIPPMEVCLHHPYRVTATQDFEVVIPRSTFRVTSGDPLGNLPRE